VHSGGANQNALSRGQILNGLIVIRQQLGTLGGNFVQAMDIVHSFPHFFPENVRLTEINVFDTTYSIIFSA
jgi:hypothetical protein